MSRLPCFLWPKVFYSQIYQKLYALIDSGVSEGLVFTSDSENEIFCDSVDSVEQLSSIKVQPI